MLVRKQPVSRARHDPLVPRLLGGGRPADARLPAIIHFTLLLILFVLLLLGINLLKGVRLLEPEVVREPAEAGKSVGVRRVLGYKVAPVLPCVRRGRHLGEARGTGTCRGLLGASGALASASGAVGSCSVPLARLDGPVAAVLVDDLLRGSIFNVR